MNKRGNPWTARLDAFDAAARKNPMSPAQGRRQRAALMRDIDRDLRVKARAKIAELRGRVKELAGKKRHAIKATVARCQKERAATKERAKERRARALAELRAAILEQRDAARSTCKAAKAAARKHAVDALERARLELEAERTEQKTQRRLENANAIAKREARKTSRYERRAESDDEVRANVPPEWAKLWEKVKRAIKGSDRETRTEAFFRYAEEHPGEVLEAIDDETDARIAELEAQQRRAEPYARAPARRAKSYTRAELEAVPF